MTRAFVILGSLAALAGCQTMPNGGTMRPPELNAVGTGLYVERTELTAAYVPPDKRAYGSLWGTRSQTLFSDLRARKIGDTVTVNIQIDDKAKFDNESERERSSKQELGVGLGFGIGGIRLNGNGADVSADLELESGSESKGSGTIDRSEKLRLSVAAVVTEILPDGNLVISGSQEIMVNEEIRVLNIAGVIRPLDISSDNTIAYDKIAEARIAYGGRGRITDVQRPAWGQRLYDGIAPF
jgi:flagellar L-ring protein precursor FlgH